MPAIKPTKDAENGGFRNARCCCMPMICHEVGPGPPDLKLTSADHTPMVLALDFDGVVCDSVGESSATAWTVRMQ